MAREKKLVPHVELTDGKRAISQQLLQKYDIESAEDIQEALYLATFEATKKWTAPIRDWGELYIMCPGSLLD